MLTQKQEEFAKRIVEGMTQIDAYKSSYDADKMTDNSISREASLLMDNPKITQRINELREQLAKSTIMTVQERLEFLTRVAKGEEKEKIIKSSDGEGYVLECEADIGTKIKAIDTMNKMTGEYVTKVEGTITTKLEDLL